MRRLLVVYGEDPKERLHYQVLGANLIVKGNRIMINYTATQCLVYFSGFPGEPKANKTKADRPNRLILLCYLPFFHLDHFGEGILKSGDRNLFRSREAPCKADRRRLR